MPPAVCPRHPARSTRFSCDGCGEHLCEECVEEGHRLLFCRLCGERALPLSGGGPATSKALKADRKRFAVYGWGDAFGYVFRGTGAYVFWSVPALLAAMTIAGQIALLGILSGCLQLIFGLIVLVILPGALFAVVRETARGESELPDWPEFHAFGDRFSEIFEFLLIALVSAIPGALMMRFSGCSELLAPSVFCMTLLALSGILATLIWIPAFGAVAVYRNFWLAFRFDLHYRAASVAPSDFTRVVVLSTLLVLVGQASAVLLLGVVPLISVAVSAIVGLYSWFTIAHLVGLLFRRHGQHFDALYRG